MNAHDPPARKDKFMKKALLVLLLTALLIPSLCSCSYYNDEQAALIIDEVLTKEAELNGYIYGNSFDTAEDPGDDVNSSYQVYYTVAPDSKYLTLSSLMEAVDGLLASGSRDEIYSYAFEGLSTDDFSAPARFAEDEYGNLQINVAENSYAGMRTAAVLGSARVLRSNKTHIKAEFTAIRTSSSGQKTEVVLDVEVIYEDGAWKLSRQTFIASVVSEEDIWG